MRIVEAKDIKGEAVPRRADAESIREGEAAHDLDLSRPRRWPPRRDVLHTCWYIGKQGVASFIGDREKATPKVVRFADVSALRTSETNVVVNGGYKHTKFVFGRLRRARPAHAEVEVTGAYNREAADRPNEYVVGKALEAEWSAWLFTNRVQQELAARGYVEFQGVPVRLPHGAQARICLARYR
ncbi:MAG: hypothetical protein U0414_25075 [Polyangiaceae bacterium]